MNITTTDINESIKKIDIQGEIDVYTSIDLKLELNNLVDNGSHKLIIDLENVTYMDSSGLGVLVALLKRIKTEEGQLKLLNLPPSVAKIFELTRLTKFFEIYNDLDNAINSF
ncbi:anti-sigma B factor antagonist [Hypnocyclicus thermotrophus]|uniref:Anti-sigma factor antagonist n=1 Tax=Hypnocyclicus thermotrophus TaxID=1627895 RepID=A0AA46I6C3_9FUSO|nr:STAS domain-containing protein [Hypnocyclicus thermotrophus]TDT71502.1 anti-sigma B factor antagonist [Hypnocyclicus thermotrophus]